MKPYTIAAFIMWGIFLILGKVGMSIEGDRVGAVSNDGWVSSSTGRGTGSHHGGVDYWLYEGGSASGIYLLAFLFFLAGWGVLIGGCVIEDKKEKYKKEKELNEWREKYLSNNTGQEKTQKKHQKMKTVVACINCDQKLCVPYDRGRLEVTCPKCSTRFDWTPNTKSPYTEPDDIHSCDELFDRPVKRVTIEEHEEYDCYPF